MSTAVTQDIRVTARSRYEAMHSDPKAGRFIFSYRITIANHGRGTVRLKSRHWIIRDSLAATREVAGSGVVGETPTLAPGEEFSYSSACDLRSGHGTMHGTYRMVRLDDQREFDVLIPEMQLRFPFAAN
ncbi:MAG: Co2+/Mg2+ efflux protein ApaG [Flavobacteriales bacterium]|nr:Co2+/Mg2+ efflux protein ApaG [Flavobacteriales bacterium]